jgi:RNA methyltransferase, TrmH family
VCRRAGAAGARIFPLGPGVLERVADTVTPQPVVAVLPMLDELGEGVEAWRPLASAGALVVVLVDVRDPGNAGTVLRAVDASGSAAVVFAADSVDPYNPKTVRSSAGSLFHVPFALRPDPVALAGELSEAGFRTTAALVRHGEDYAAIDWSVPTALFLGNESSGLDPAVADRAAAALAIPMAGRAESLNVGVACAVVCFEAYRQRRGGGPAPRSISGSGSADDATRHGD